VRYDWVVVGGGVAGITLSEILTREGHSVLLVDKELQLASETTKIFHEWIHTGSLYTLIPDRLTTLKFLLGAIDDLLEYYSCFERMNLLPTESGLSIDGSEGWFRPDLIEFRYKRRLLNAPWSLLTARSCHLVEQIKKHDWLRRRGGVLDELRRNRVSGTAGFLAQLVREKADFFSTTCSDFTTNSRILLQDLVATAMANGLELSLANRVLKIEETGGYANVVTENGTFQADRVVLSAGGAIPAFADVGVKTTIAPMAVVRGVSEESRSFVELDCYVRNCINLVKKPFGVGLIGGISVDREEDAHRYIQYVIERHRKLNSNIDVLGTYLGYKHEIVFKNQDRNYLFHIVSTGDRTLAVVPGKFTLGFSMAAEFYRRVYHRNPRKWFSTSVADDITATHVAETSWYEMYDRAKETE
jgi:glycine/D-amino acid oxidase-like deaminating enzyme